MGRSGVDGRGPTGKGVVGRGGGRRGHRAEPAEGGRTVAFS